LPARSPFYAARSSPPATMSHVAELSLSSLLGLFTPQALYLLAYAWLLGMSIWVSFFAGPIAFRALPRQQFGTLQGRVFPVYSASTVALSSVLLGLWTYSHPAVIAHVYNPIVADVTQAYTLAIVLLAATSNSLIIGPLTSHTKDLRHKLQKDEGKAYDEPGVSDEMKALNKRFGALHGTSMLVNLFSVIALLFHGLWIGNVGIEIKGF